MKQRYQPNRRNRALEHPSVDGINTRTASLDDAAAIAEIYNQGIETASPPMKPDGDLRKISRRGFKPLLVVIPLLLRRLTAN